MENNIELEDMRQQMNLLKDKLVNQTIVNDNLISKAMRGNASWINKKYIICIVIAVLMVPYSLIVLRALGLSMAFNITTCVFMLIAAAYTYYNGKALRDNTLFSSDMFVAGQRMAHAKKMDSDWLKFSIPFMVVWLGWFSVEAYSMEDSMAFCVGGIIGLITGGTSGYITHKKVQRKYREIMEQLEDLSRDKEQPHS